MDYPVSVPGVGLVGGKFVDEDQGVGQIGSLIPAAWGNAVTDELLAVIAGAGFTPDEEDNGQLARAIQSGALNVAVAGGTADAITAAFAPAIAALYHGMTLYVRASAANTTTTPTFAPDGLTAKTIVKGSGSVLVAGDIAGAGHWLVLTYDQTMDKWVIGNPNVSLAIASPSEAQGQTDNTKMLTPLRLAEALQGANQSLGATGYQKLPGGLILQWGYTTTSGGSATASIVFPVSFPNALLSVGGIGVSANDRLLVVTASSATGFNCTTYVAASGGSAVTNFFWFAIGH